MQPTGCQRAAGPAQAEVCHMHYMPTGGRGREVRQLRTNATGSSTWARMARDVQGAREADREVREYAKARGIECAPQRKRVKRKSARKAESPHGQCRTLNAAECHALGYELTKPVQPRAATRTVWNWREGRQIAPNWV